MEGDKKANQSTSSAASMNWKRMGRQINQLYLLPMLDIVEDIKVSQRFTWKNMARGIV
jgi:hypothetical protein